MSTLEKIQFEIEGTAPLMCHNIRLADPLDPFTREIRKVVSRENKTNDDHRELSKLEWQGSFYKVDFSTKEFSTGDDGEKGPVVESRHLHASIKNGAKLIGLGKNVDRGIKIVGHNIPIEYDGPKELKLLWKDPRFRDKRRVKIKAKSHSVDKRRTNNKNTVMRTRPIFEDWGLSFSIIYNNRMFKSEDVVDMVKSGGEMIGLLEFRPTYGTFKVTSHKQVAV